jgi:hypothetical protein
MTAPGIWAAQCPLLEVKFGATTTKTVENVLKISQEFFKPLGFAPIPLMPNGKVLVLSFNDVKGRANHTIDKNRAWNCDWGVLPLVESRSIA